MRMAEAVAHVLDEPSRPPDRAELPGSGSRIHLVGVAGAGMRGLAKLLTEDGYRVSGCDAGGAGGMGELTDLGVELTAGHDPEHVELADLVVYSAAVPEEAPELTAARSSGVPVLKRARALGAFLSDRLVVGISGTHGKTTITAMTGIVCEAGGLEPMVVVGGRVDRWNGFAHTGGGEIAIVEADEYDRSFLQLDPSLAVVSSLEPEHLDIYGSLDALREAYAQFAAPAVARHGVLYCEDEPGARELGRELGSDLSYGFSEDAAYRVLTLPEKDGGNGGQRCRLEYPHGAFEFKLAAPGRHNVQNAASALAVALRLGADPDDVRAGLVGFEGVARRLQILADRNGIAVVDDYAHHPTEVRASIQALRERFGGRRLVIVFQPHLYSRTRDFANEFAAELAAADAAYVLPIYPSRERPIEGVTASLITRAGPASVAEADASAVPALVTAARQPVVFAFLGAGDVTELAARAAEQVPDDAVGA